MPLLPALALRYHVFAPDLRGHGKSSWTPGAYGVRDDAEDVIALLQERVGQPAILVGQSYGGAVAAVVAAIAPDRVRGLVLTEPVLAIFAEGYGNLADVIPYYSAMYNILTTDGDKLAALAQLIPDGNSLSLRRYLRKLTCMDPERLLVAIERRVHSNLSLQSLLPQISCPVVLMQGNPTLGALLDDATVAATIELLSDCIHVQRADVGHEMFKDQPMALVQMVTDFAEIV